MEIKTKAYGIVEIDPKEIITFEKGLIGFEDKRQFVLLGNPEVAETLVWMQSLDDPDLAFVVIQPRHFKPDYRPAINIAEIEELEVDDPELLLLYAIVVVPPDISKMTANLKAPVVINVKNNKAKQVILNDDRYKIKHLILGDTPEEDTNACSK